MKPAGGTLTLQLLTRAQLSEPAEIEAFFAVLCDEFPEFAPDLYNHFEPVSRAFTDAVRRKLAAGWESPFLWRCAHLEMYGAVNQRPPGRGSRHATIEMDFTQPPANEARVRDFFYSLARRFRPDLAFIHLLAPREEAMAVATGMSFKMGGRVYPPRLSTEKLKRGLPNLFWLTLLGPPYVKLFGRERLYDAPAENVDYLDDDLIALQLSPSWSDIGAHYAAVDGTRELCRRHLGEDAFAPDAPDAAPRLPDFSHLEPRGKTTVMLRGKPRRNSGIRKP